MEGRCPVHQEIRSPFKKFHAVVAELGVSGMVARWRKQRC